MVNGPRRTVHDANLIEARILIMGTGVFVLAGFVAWLAVMILSATAWKAISLADSGYAEKLFARASDQLIGRLGPVRWEVLFLKSAPRPVYGWVLALRAAVILQLMAMLALVASLLDI